MCAHAAATQNFAQCIAMSEQRAGLWQQLAAAKPAWQEPHGADELDKNIQGYYAAIRSGSGALFLAVCRGKVHPCSSKPRNDSKAGDCLHAGPVTLSGKHRCTASPPCLCHVSSPPVANGNRVMP